MSRGHGDRWTDERSGQGDGLATSECVDRQTRKMYINNSRMRHNPGQYP